jgi:hypothetical protein
MPIFGQVWLWSLLAFLLGAVLCWLLVARPARNRVGELEAQLTDRARRQPGSERLNEADLTRSVVPGLGDRDDSEYLTSAYRLRETPPPLPPERDRLAPYPPESAPDLAAQPEPFGLSGGLAAPPEPENAEPPRAAATQYLDVSAGSLTAPPEVPQMSPPPSDRGWFDDELEGDAANQAPEEQPAVPRNRHQLVEPEQYDARLVDDEADDIISDVLDDTRGDGARSAVEDDGGTVFTQRTHPIPGELIRQIDEAGKEERAEVHAESAPASHAETFVDDLPAHSADNRAESFAGSRAESFADGRAESFADSPSGDFAGDPAETLVGNRAQSFADNLVDDLADEPGEDEVARRERTVESEPVAPPTGFGAEPATSSSGFGAEPAASSGDFGSEQVFPPSAFTEPTAEPAYAEQNGAEPEPVTSPELPQEQTEVVAAVTEQASKPVGDLPRRVPQANRISSTAQSVAVRVDPTPNALPKRVPGKPRHQVPFGVMPGMTPEPEPVPAAAAEPVEPARSLFEPIIPATDEGMSTPPPPHRLRQGSGGGRGPFGPGSAMPLPGGASPSPEFTIKASVAALRYCTPESPQFGRTVAEVWFRTAADAERVGFRPVG